MKHKAIQSLLSALLLVAVVAGCAAPATVTQAPTAEPPQTVTITLWDYFVTQGPAVDEALALFQQQNPTIKVNKTTQQVSEYPNLVQLAFAGDSAPDIFVRPDGVSISQAAKNGWAAPLSDFADFPEFLKRYDQPNLHFVEGVNVLEGKTYAAGDGVAGAPWLQLYINRDVLDAAGLKNADGSYIYPKTWDDLVAHSKTIKEQTGKYGLGWGSENFEWFVWACQTSAPFYTDTIPNVLGFDPRSGKFMWENASMKAMINSLLAMKANDTNHPDSVVLGDEAMRVKFAAGEFAYLYGGTWIIPGWDEKQPEFKNYTLVPVPLCGTETVQSKFYVSSLATSAMGIDYLISAKSTPEKQAAAWKLIQFMNSADWNNIMAKKGVAVGKFTTLNPSDYATTDAWKAFYSAELTELNISGPSAPIRKPDTAQLQFTLQGPAIASILQGLYTGQLTDVDAALKDLSERSQAAFEQALADAKAAGVDLTAEDFIFADWNPTQPYQNIPGGQ
jgi:ABC-type glycerol-3-phosphate transport system substrate-binding protein